MPYGGIGGDPASENGDVVNLEDLKRKADAATPETSGPIFVTIDGSGRWYPVHRPDCAWETHMWPCNCDVFRRRKAVDEFIAAANPQVVLALVRALEGISYLHVPDQYGACLGCGSNESGYAIVTWPCETAAIIQELEAMP